MKYHFFSALSAGRETAKAQATCGLDQPRLRATLSNRRFRSNRSFDAFGVPDVKQRSRQPSPGDSPQELGVRAAPAFEPLVHSVAIEQIGMRHPQTTGTGSRPLVAIELA